MNEYLNKLISNFAALRNLSIGLNHDLSTNIAYRDSVLKFYEFLRVSSEKTSILVILPEGVTIEDNFCPYSTYSTFISSDPESKNLLEEFAYAINTTVGELSKTGILGKDTFIKSLPEQELLKFFELISDEKLQKIKDLALKLSEKIKTMPFLTSLWQGEAQNFLLQKRIKAQKDDLEQQKKDAEQQEVEFKQQKTELNVSEEWHRHFEARAKEIRQEIRLLNKTSMIFWKLRIPGKVTLLRIAVYSAPVFSAFIGLFAIANGQELSFKHYEFAASMILLLSVLSYHLKHALRELNILKHMHSSYLHRAIVAKTFQSISGRFTGGEGKIVIKEAALAMFKKEAQGYLSKDQMEPSNTPLQEIVGIFKNK